MLRSARRAVAALVLLLVTLTTAACSGGSAASGTATQSGAPGAPSAPSSVTPTRWWSNSAVTAGSTIDPAKPEAAAGELHPSQADYCGMLKQTLDSGNSILPGITANDPALLVSSRAFVAELEHVAPAEVAGDWHVIGPAVLGLVKSGGVPSAIPSLDVSAVSKAVAAVSAHAKKVCGLDLSAVSGAAGVGKPTK